MCTLESYCALSHLLREMYHIWLPKAIIESLFLKCILFVCMHIYIALPCKYLACMSHKHTQALTCYNTIQKHCFYSACTHHMCAYNVLVHAHTKTIHIHIVYYTCCQLINVGGGIIFNSNNGIGLNWCLVFLTSMDSKLINSQLVWISYVFMILYFLSLPRYL